MKKNRYELTNEVKQKYTPIIQSYINQFESAEIDNESLAFDLSETELNPFTLCKLLEDCGYEQEDTDTNGWQMDFWITMTKSGAKSLQVRGTGITFEMILTLK